jgi:hypothetical protein
MKEPTTCIYCGSSPAATADHVPPRTIFAKPYPPNLKTVPACRPCNEGFSKDDEYFKQWLTVPDLAKGHPDREGVVGSVVRSLNRREAPGLRRMFQASTFPAERYSEAGIYMGEGKLISMDGKRIAATVERTTRGLFFLETGEALPRDATVNVLDPARFKLLDDATKAAVSDFAAALESQPKQAIGRAFDYQWMASPFHKLRSVWLMRFYETHTFFCQTYEPEDPDSADAESSKDPRTTG